jgi:hypothetical protein
LDAIRFSGEVWDLMFLFFFPHAAFKRGAFGSCFLFSLFIFNVVIGLVPE